MRRGGIEAARTSTSTTTAAGRWGERTHMGGGRRKAGKLYRPTGGVSYEVLPRPKNFTCIFLAPVSQGAARVAPENPVVRRTAAPLFQPGQRKDIAP